MKRLLQSILVLSLAAGGCSPETEAPEPQAPAAPEKDDAASAERNAALQALRNAEVIDVAEDGSPTFVRGDLGKLGDVSTLSGLVTAQARGRDAADAVAPAFGGRAEDLEFVRSDVDHVGHTHLRYAQRINGLPVVGGELRLHADAAGKLFLANGRLYRARGPETASVAAEAAAATAAASGSATLRVDDARTLRLVYAPAADGRLRLAWEAQVSGVEADGLPVRDLVYVDARSGAVLQRLPQIHTALNRALYSANNGTSLPGTLKRSEGGAATGDTTIDQNYADLGLTYNCYKTLFNRDGLDGRGSRMVSTVHYSTNYNNAYWDSTQMVYGDGDGSTFGPLGRDQDVTVHELTHGVTENESGLQYQNESGALNEAMSDIASAFCDSWNRSWAVDTAVWNLAERSWTPGTSGDAMRYMANPTQDGSSKDYYPERYTGTSDSGGVHWNSGIANLAFKLLVTGGTHPRNKTTVNVRGVGMDKAAQIFYYANANIMVSSTNFSGARTATERASDALGYGALVKASVSNAWAAVGVGSAVSYPSDDSVAPTTSLTAPAAGTTVSNTVTVSADASDNVGVEKVEFYAGSSLIGSDTTSPYSISWNTTQTANGSVALTSKAYDAAGNSGTSSAVNVTVQNDGPPPDPDTVVLTNGTAVALSGATGSSKHYSIAVPAGQTSLVVRTSGGSGDLDIYVRLGEKATTTTYTCKSEQSSNSESCSIPNPAAGTYYVLVYGYAAYSGASLTATYSASSGNVLQNGVPVTGISGAQGSVQNWTLVVPSGRTSVTFRTSGGTGDVDLYARLGSAPTTTTYGCKSDTPYTAESCTIYFPSAGTYYVQLRGYTAYSGVSLTGSY